jgi:hypothetical protein
MCSAYFPKEKSSSPTVRKSSRAVLRSVLQVFIFFICKEYPFSLAKAQKFFYDEHPYLIKFRNSRVFHVKKYAQQYNEAGPADAGAR